MMYVNLLPWRQQYWLRRRRRFLSALGLALTVAAGVVTLLAVRLQEHERVQLVLVRALQQELDQTRIRAAGQSELKTELGYLRRSVALLLDTHKSLLAMSELLQVLPIGNTGEAALLSYASTPLHASAMTLTQLHHDGSRLRLAGFSRHAAGIAELSDAVTSLSAFTLPAESHVSLQGEEHNYQFQIVLAAPPAQQQFTSPESWPDVFPN